MPGKTLNISPASLRLPAIPAKLQNIWIAESAVFLYGLNRRMRNGSPARNTLRMRRLPKSSAGRFEMERLGFLYDTTRCVGCKACQIACKEQNKLGAGEFFRRVETLTEGGSPVHFSAACNHCENPACAAVCPTGAMYIAEDGTVQHDDGKCVGCGRCVHHCPYGAPSLNKRTGYAQKCDGCARRRKEGLDPACAAACPTRALHFGPLSRADADMVSSGGLSFLPPASLTGPSLRLRRKAGGVKAEDAAPPAPREEAPPAFRRDTKQKFLILGGGVAAVSAARAIRARNASASIRIVSGEDRIPYCRPMLSKGLLNGFSEDRYPVAGREWLEENRIRLTLGRTVESLDPAARTAALDDGTVLPYDKCVYALGARCFLPPITGRSLPGVFTLRSDTDLRAIRRRMLSASRAVVVGGGITGLEIAWEMKKAGLRVTVLDLAPVLMGRLLDRRSAEALRRRIEDAGIPVATGVRIKALEGGSGGVASVALEDGRSFPAELVLLSTGFRANTAVAEQAGLSAGRAVAVTEAMETSDPDIYACGDCTDRSLSTWMQSVRQGEVAGANAAGDRLVFQPEPEPAMVHTADTSLLSIGDMGKDPEGNYHLVYGSADSPKGRFYINPKTVFRQETFYSLCFRDGELAGATLIGDLSEMLFIQEAVRRHSRESEFLEELLRKGIEIHAD